MPVVDDYVCHRSDTLEASGGCPRGPRYWDFITAPPPVCVPAEAPLRRQGGDAGKAIKPSGLSVCTLAVQLMDQLLERVLRSSNEGQVP